MPLISNYGKATLYIDRATTMRIVNKLEKLDMFYNSLACIFRNLY